MAREIDEARREASVSSEDQDVEEMVWLTPVYARVGALERVEREVELVALRQT